MSVSDHARQQQTDEELMRLTRAQPECFRYLMERYEARLLRFIKRISSVPEEEAEDILQEAFINMYRSIHSFDPKWKFSSWAYRIVRHEVIDHFRKRKARPQVTFSDLPLDVVEHLSGAMDMERNVDALFDREKIVMLLSHLEEKYKEVLVLKFLEEKSYEEISDILKKPMGTVATRISRAKKQLREIIKQKGMYLD